MIIPEYILISREVSDLYQSFLDDDCCLDFFDENGKRRTDNDITIKNWNKPIYFN